MSEYTPTTQEVEDSYQWGVNACGCCAIRDEADVEAFRRWLAEEKARTLDEAADSAQAKMFSPAVYVGNQPLKVTIGARAWLRARAAEIRERNTND